MIYGSNVLLTAITALGSTNGVVLYKFTGRTTNNYGMDVNAYADPVVLDPVFVIPLNRKVYQMLGLDFQKNYIQIYAETDLQDLQRDVSSDYVMLNGKRYDLQSERDWFQFDGWTSCLAVEVPNE